MSDVRRIGANRDRPNSREASIHEQELHIKIENGIVVARRVIANRGKTLDEWQIGLRNLPGNENRFPGDEDL